MPIIPKQRFTRHAKERWVERFPGKYDGNVVGTMAKELYRESAPDNSFRNHTGFLTYLYDTYGYDGGDFEFYVSNDVVFVCRNGALITVYARSSSLFARGQSGRYRK